MGCGSSPAGVAETRRTIMQTNKKGAVHVPPGEGKKLWVAEELMTFVASGEDTGGKYALTDSTVPPQGGAPPHIHHREDEAFWVLEGDLEVVVGEDKIGASAGSFVHLPSGVIHTYKNVGATPARFLTLMVPAGLERFFEEVGKPGTDPSTPPPFGEEDVERLLAIAPNYGVEILPPPEQ
jgi:mannose-6-phosphate isomerase-like protein (cupin superfamily)